MMTTSRLSAECVSYTLGEKTILAALSLELRTGEVLALVGPNGAGKSSLLSLFAGSLSPTQGRVSLAGRTLADWKPADLAARRAVLSQNIAMNFPLNVAQVVALGASYCVPAAGVEASVAAVLAELELTPMAQRPYTQLSGGQQQRVQLARVLLQLGFPQVRAGQFLLLDEPTSALDVAFQHRVLNWVQRLTREFDLGVLLVIHDINLAACYADRVAVLDSGRLSSLVAAEAFLEARLLSSVFDHPFDVLECATPVGERRFSLSRRLSLE